jgi:hypothetical protein
LELVFRYTLFYIVIHMSVSGVQQDLILLRVFSMQKRNVILFSLVLTGCVLQLNRCGKPESSDNTILARVGPRIITESDFQARAELTIRPGNIKTPQAVLNNLIAEKLFALESDDSELARSEIFQAYIQGIREQAMREQLYIDIAVKPVRLDDAEIDSVYRLSQRAYDLEFFTINNPQITQDINERLMTHQNTPGQIFESLKSRADSGNQTVKWRDPENDNIHRALYSKQYNSGEVIGPVRIADKQWIIMRVMDVKIQPVIGPEDTALRLKEVREKLTDLKAKMTWQQYKDRLMRGKEVRFEKEVFETIVNWYIEIQKNKELEQQKESADSQYVPGPPASLNQMLDRPFFHLDGKIWTVGDFKQAIMRHPLVYRQQPADERFPERFKTAVADLLVDHFLNQEAYRRGLDKRAEVKKQGELWSDSYLAHDYVTNYLRKINIGELQKKDYTYKGTRAIDEYLGVLSKKYGNDIQVNSQLLRKLDLISIPLVAMRQGMPYPLAVPGFPIYTNTDSVFFKHDLRQ